MPSPAFLTGAPWKLTIFIDGGAFGWTESFYYCNTGMTPDQNDALLAVSCYAQNRDNYLPYPWNIVGARITDLSNFGSSQPYANDTLGVNFATGPSAVGPGGPVWTAALVRMADPTNSVRRMMMWRGINQADQTNFNSQPGSYKPGPLTAQMLPVMFSVLNGNIRSAGKASYQGRFAMKATNSIGRTAQSQVIQAGNLDPTTGFMRYLTPNQPSWPIGSYVHVANIRSGCNKGLSGKFRVITTYAATSPQTGFWTVVNKYPCCRQVGGAPAPVNVVPGGLIYPYTPGYVAIQGGNFRRYAEHKTGRPFFGTVGRRPGKCC